MLPCRYPDQLLFYSSSRLGWARRPGPVLPRTHRSGRSDADVCYAGGRGSGRAAEEGGSEGHKQPKQPYNRYNSSGSHSNSRGRVGLPGPSGVGGYGKGKPQNSRARPGGMNLYELNGDITACRDIHALAQLVQKHVHGFNEVNVSTAISKAAKLQRSGQHVARQLVEEVLSVAAARLLGQMRARELANTLWSLAKLGLQPRNGLVALLLEECRPKLQAFESQSLANTVWALATLDFHDDAFVSLLVKAALPRLGDFNSQDLANTVWALATLDFHDDAFVLSLVEVARPRLGEFNCQELANTAQALATLGCSDTAFIGELAAAAKPKLAQFNSQGLAITLHALAKLQHYDDDLVAQLVNECKARLDSFNQQDLATSAWALSEMRWRDEQLMQMIQRRLLGLGASSGANSQAFSNTALAIAKLGCPLDASLGKQLAAMQASCSFQSVCNLAWAHAVSGDLHQAWLQGLVLDRVRHLGGAQRLAPEDQGQLFQYFLELHESGVMQVPGPDAATLMPLIGHCRQAWLELVELRAAQPINSFQADVLLHCQQQPGWQVLGGEHLTEDGLFAIDVALQLVSRDGAGCPPIKVAVEAEGPTHFTRNEPHVVLGRTAARNRSLQRRGWAVLSIPFYEWHVLQHSPAAKSSYLGARLHQLLESC